MLGGFEVVDFKATVVDGSYHDVDSSEMAFKIAGSMAFKEALAKADPCLLEPMMKVEVIIPEQYMGDVIGDISSRRGRIEGMEARMGEQTVHAYVPLSEMFGYATDLRCRTQGRGTVHHAVRPLRGSAQVRWRRRSPARGEERTDSAVPWRTVLESRFRNYRPHVEGGNSTHG